MKVSAMVGDAAWLGVLNDDGDNGSGFALQRLAEGLATRRLPHGGHRLSTAGDARIAYPAALKDAPPR